MRDAIAGGAQTVDEIGDSCLAGTCCSGCHPTLEHLLDEARVDELSVTAVAVRSRQARFLTA